MVTSLDHSIDYSESLPMTFNLTKGLKICHWNSRGLYSKMTDIKMLLSQPGKECDILGISESWLHDHLDTEVEVPGYTLVRKDRSDGKKGGGVVIYLKGTMVYTRRKDLEYIQDEFIWIELTFNYALPMLLCFTY